MKEIKLIKLYFLNSLQQNVASLFVFLLFFAAKLVRYSLFLGFLYLMTSKLKFIGDYTQTQMLVFYLCFNVIDTSGQLLFREVYRFRSLIVSGGFDMVLAKPSSPLIRVLFGGPDLIDVGVLIILIGVLISAMSILQPTIWTILGFLALVFNSLLISTAFHVLVLTLGVLTTSVDHLVMVYRDLTGLVRVPVDFYTQPLRAIITFVIPLGIMFTYPAKALMGLLSWPVIISCFALGVLVLLVSIKFWNFSLKHYQSASS